MHAIVLNRNRVCVISTAVDADTICVAHYTVDLLLWQRAGVTMTLGAFCVIFGLSNAICSDHVGFSAPDDVMIWNVAAPNGFICVRTKSCFRPTCHMTCRWTPMDTCIFTGTHFPPLAPNTPSLRAACKLLVEDIKLLVGVKRLASFFVLMLLFAAVVAVVVDICRSAVS